MFKIQFTFWFIIFFWAALIGPQNPTFSQTSSFDCQSLFNSQQFETAFDTCLPLADQGDLAAQVNVGRMYMMGYGVQEDALKAIEYLKKAANQGHIQSAYAVGAMLTTGEMIPPNYEEALPWIRIASLGGSPDAKDLLSLYYLQGLGGVEIDKEKAFQSMEIAASMGRPASIFKLATFYEQGIGTPINKEKALEQYQKASQAGYLPATQYLQSPQGKYSLNLEGSPTPLPPMEVEVKRGIDAVKISPPRMDYALRSLTERPLSENEEIIEFLKNNVRELPTPYIFELSRRLGFVNMDEAVVWFKVAYIRAIFDANKCTDRTARQGIIGWSMWTSDVSLEIINNPEKEQETILKALKIEKTFPIYNSPQWICIEGMQALRSSLKGEELKDWHFPISEWPRIREETRTSIKENKPQ